VGGFLAAALALGGGLAAKALVHAGHSGARPTQVAAHQPAGGHAHHTHISLTSAPHPWIL